MTQKIYPRTDIGDDIDDALALGLILASTELELVGVTTSVHQYCRPRSPGAHCAQKSPASEYPRSGGLWRDAFPHASPRRSTRANVTWRANYPTRMPRACPKASCRRSTDGTG
jgi:hypothetical protein